MCVLGLRFPELEAIPIKLADEVVQEALAARHQQLRSFAQGAHEAVSGHKIHSEKLIE